MSCEALRAHAVGGSLMGTDAPVTREALDGEGEGPPVERSGLFLVLTVFSVALLAVSLLRPFSALELLTRILLTTLLLVGASLARSVAPKRDAVVAVILVAAALLAALVAALAGGVESPEFGFLFAVPFIAGLILPNFRGLVWLIGVVVLVVAEALLFAAGIQPLYCGMWAILLAGGTTVATMGARASTRLLASRTAAERGRRQAAEQLAESEHRRAQSDRLALLGRLAAGVAHELSNPLTYLSTNLQLLEREAETLQSVSRRDVQSAVAESMRAVEHMTEVLRDLRRFARSDGLPEVRPTDVLPVVEEAILLASVRLRGVHLERAFSPDVPRVSARRRRLVQVLVNLLMNAADAVAEPGASARRIRVAVSHGEGMVTLSVEDSGLGLTPEARAKLFQPFFTTKPPGKGTGLGLALSREYVEADGGTLRCEEVQGGGARFLVILPQVQLLSPSASTSGNVT